MIRPSSLSIARFCQLAPVLSERFPSRNENTDRGNDVDGQATGELRDGVVATDADAKALITWVREEVDGQDMTVQGEVSLRDPDTGGLLTRGTPDVVLVGASMVTIIDFKKREQWLAGHLAAPDDNLQLHAYGLAVAQANESREYQLCLLLFGDGEVEPKWSRVYDAEAWTPVLEEIRAIQDRQSEAPVATSGPHCLACYPRMKCEAWTLPAHQGPTELEPFTKPGGLTVENFERGLRVRKALEDTAALVDAQLKAFVEANGGSVPLGGGKVYRPVWGKGKAGIDKEKLTADGLLEKYTKRGEPFPTYRITNAKGAR